MACASWSSRRAGRRRPAASRAKRPRIALDRPEQVHGGGTGGGHLAADGVERRLERRPLGGRADAERDPERAAVTPMAGAPRTAMSRMATATWWWSRQRRKTSSPGRRRWSINTTVSSSNATVGTTGPPRKPRS
jgi:hypothetical protein